MHPSPCFYTYEAVIHPSSCFCALLGPLCSFTFSPCCATSAHTPLSDGDAKKNIKVVQSSKSGRPAQQSERSHSTLHPDSACLISTRNHSKGTGSDSLDSNPIWQHRPADIIATSLVSVLFSSL